MVVNYPISSKFVLDEANDHVLETIKRAGVDKIWLHGYFYGHMQADIETLVKAREHLREKGFETAVCNVPFNHPGNALSEDVTDEQLRLPPTWRYRHNRHGDPVYYCADIEDVLIRDTVKALETLLDAGFTEIFMDDDLRQGDWDKEIQGCFCEHCIADFNARYCRHVDRAALSAAIEGGAREHAELLREWIDFNCDKVTRFISETAATGVTVGHMVMADGDERHGIDIRAIVKAHPACFFRVGEHQFNDYAFGSPEGKARQVMSALKHLNRFGTERAYSETTVFPERMLKAANLVYKAKIALSVGIRNIMIMSGTYVLPEDYWAVWTDARQELLELDAAYGGCRRSYPVHIVYGTHGIYQEDLWQPTVPILSGLPAKPARPDEADAEGEILCVFGNYILGREWQEKIGQYAAIVLDEEAAEKNPDIASRGNARICGGNIPSLRQAIASAGGTFPRIVEGENIILVWIKEKNAVILLNTNEEEMPCRIDCAGAEQSLVLGPLEVASVRL